MRIIGITGGVGAGKTQVLQYLQHVSKARIVMADEVSHDLTKRGKCCYEPLIALLGEEVLDETGEIDRKKMAAVIFQDRNLLLAVNAIVHPAVKQFICAEIEREKKAGSVSFFFLEAALLIEEHYDEICDELWYIYAEESVRVRRLMTNRGYTKEKIRQIMNGQLTDKQFRGNCHVIIDNSGETARTFEQIDRKLEEYL